MSREKYFFEVWSIINHEAINLIKHHLDELCSQFGRKISRPHLKLTPRELEVCNMIKAGLSSLFTGAINIFIGILELLSQFIRIVSFTFRLFGNMTAGEILLLVALFLVPWLLALPFYGLELLVGFIQALIFAGLTLIFLTVAVTAHHEWRMQNIN